MIRDAHTAQGLEARAAKKADGPRPESKGDRQAKLKSVSMTAPVNPPASPFAAADPQPEPKEEPKTEAKATEPKKREKRADGEKPADRESVKKWKAQKEFTDDQIIHILSKENPKRRAAGERFAEYKEGMTVKAYIEVMDKKGRKRGATMGDIRWDHAQGFIRVD